ncbi:MAG: DUF6069 family protein [Gordonia sp. (in: high G+C Gram-positive bacteria)]|uniref:DUF6069 family protein n=1 Tax=Gordonia sp. (in: high G+C Gram-positive bacteria) TaxID=84139 RepID=UPI003BB60223
MTYSDPNDPRRRTPQTRAYSSDPGYQQGYTQGQPYTQGQQYSQGQPYPQGQPAEQPARGRRGPDIDPLMFAGGVFMTGVVTGLAAWLVAWIIGLIARGVNAATNTGTLNPLDPGGEYWFALVGFIAALVGGALWYILQLVTPTPNSFYRWIVGLLIIAAFVVPLTVDADIWRGLATGILHVCIGIPILSLIPTMGSRSQRSNPNTDPAR